MSSTQALLNHCDAPFFCAHFNMKCYSFAPPSSNCLKPVVAAFFISKERQSPSAFPSFESSWIKWPLDPHLGLWKFFYKYTQLIDQVRDASDGSVMGSGWWYYTESKCVGQLCVCRMRVPAEKKGVEDGSEGGDGEEEGCCGGGGLRKEVVLGCTFVWEKRGGWGMEGGGGERRRRRGNEREGRVAQGRSCGQHPPPSPLSACPSQLPVLPELKWAHATLWKEPKQKATAFPAPQTEAHRDWFETTST